MKLAILAIVLLAYSKGIYSLPHENGNWCAHLILLKFGTHHNNIIILRR